MYHAKGFKIGKHHETDRCEEDSCVRTDDDPDGDGSVAVEVHPVNAVKAVEKKLMTSGYPDSTKKTNGGNKPPDENDFCHIVVVNLVSTVVVCNCRASEANILVVHCGPCKDHPLLDVTPKDRSASLGNAASIVDAYDAKVSIHGPEDVVVKSKESGHMKA